MNNYEHIKSGLLIGLICLSMVLTWKIWAFQPDIAIIDDSAQYIPSEVISEERNLMDVIQPEQIIVHQKEGHAMIPQTSVRFDLLYKTILDSTFNENEMSVLTIGSFPKHLESGGIEVVFPTAIPADVFLGLFHIERNELAFPLTTINRLFLYVDAHEEKIVMQVMSSEDKKVIEIGTSFSLKEFESFVTEFDSYQSVIMLDESPPYMSIKEDIYISEEPVIAERLSFAIVPISGEFFRQTLFTDPDSVKYYRKSVSEESYTDGSRIIDMRNNGLFMEYNNPVFSDVRDRSSKHIVQSSYEFINGHGGWTDEYLLSNWVSTDVHDEAEYRLQVNHHPVISFDGLDQMVLRVSRSGNQTESYLRPLFDLDSRPIDVREEVELRSGQEVIEQVKQQDFFDLERLQKVIVGYEMFMPSRSFVTLEPNWFVLYDDRWQKVVFDIDEGRDSDELE